MNREGIRKASWFAYKYLRALQGREIPTADEESWAATDGRKVSAIVWDWVLPAQTVSNRPFYTKVLPAASTGTVNVRFSGVRPGIYQLQVRRTGFRANDAHTAYLEMGSPTDLTPQQLAELQRLTEDRPERRNEVTVPASGVVDLPLPMRSNDVILIELVPGAGERG